MTGERRARGVIGGPDPVEPEAERVDEIAHVPVEVRCGDTDLGAADQVRPGFGSSGVGWRAPAWKGAAEAIAPELSARIASAPSRLQ